ncbi:MAG: Tetratricopeptide 2 repeat protein [Myxococcales bacterium]|nr:Tetratricopeptide 2 repeat protein [Myxococcales bacterium]
MSTTTTNRALSVTAGMIVLALAWASPAHALKPVAEKAAHDDATEAPATGKPVAKTPDVTTDENGEKVFSPALQKAIDERETQVTAARREAIRLIEDYLRDSPRSREQAEALYKLAELYWEESKATYLDRMGAYQAAVTACHEDRSTCPRVPHKPPTVDLTRAQAVYQRLIVEHPRFRKIDTVIYLYAFSLRDQGKVAESVKYFQTLLDRYPRSRYLADAWMAIAEYRFYEQQNYKSALEAYERVLKHPKSQLYDLALFKTAWCYWKLGDTTKSAMRFKDVLDLAKGKAGRTDVEQKRAAELQGQALDYLVELFTEDDTKSAHDAFEFLAQIGGKQYSKKVLKQLADTVFDQTRYERAVEAYRLLIELDPNSVDAPDYAGKIVEAYQLLGDTKTAVAEMRKLASDYGAKSSWAAANKDRPKSVQHARTMAEQLIRTLAKTMHAEAQQNEKSTKVVDKDRYSRAAESYAFYLQSFPDAADAVELRYLRADILYFKLGRYEEAGRDYLAVGKSQPVGKYHKDALLQAMGAFEKVRRPASAGGKREITESDRLFGEAADVYATLFPNDKEIVTVVFKNGQFFFDYGDYDEAIKRFGLIVEKYPDDPNAGPAGDRILEALNKAKDYENIETWARRLKKTKAFSARDEQERLDKLVLGAVMKSGEKYANDGQYEKAASFYQRVAQEYPQSPLAPKALNNAGAVFEKARKQDEAVVAYKTLADKYPTASEAPEALFTAARIEENIAYYDKAAALYEQLAQRYPQNPHAADALRSAGVLREGLGQHDRAIKHFGEYSKRFKDKSDAKDVAFQVAVVRENQKDWKQAAGSFGAYARAYPSDARVTEAHAREADASLKAGNENGAKDASAKALASFKAGARKKSGNNNDDRGEDASYYAAEARYIQGELVFRDYEHLKIAGKPKQLAKVLEEKAKKLEEAKKIYLDVVTYQSPEWATAALLRIGQGYEAYAKAMRGAPVPKDLTEEEQQIYRDELEKVVVVIEDKSLDAYKSGYARAIQIGVYTKHTQQIREALSRLAENEYPKEAELRATIRGGEPRVGLDRIEEVRRDQ